MDQRSTPADAVVFGACALAVVAAGALLVWASPTTATVVAVVLVALGLGLASPWAPAAVRSVQRTVTRTPARAAGFVGLPALVALAAAAGAIAHPAAGLAVIVAVLLAQWGAAVVLERHDREVASARRAGAPRSDPRG